MQLHLREKLDEIIQLFREKGAINKEGALTLEELNLPRMFKHLMSSPMMTDLPFIEEDGRYYLDEKHADDIQEGMMPGIPFSNWVKQTGRVPRGYLRYRVLLMLRNKSMAGSEISDKIERDTAGRYRPSPGSVYPLLQQLKERGIIEELPVVDGKKRYRLTELGQAFLDEQTGMFEQMRKRLISGPVPAPPFLELPDNIKYLSNSAQGLFRRMMEIAVEICENPDPDLAKEVDSLFRKTSRKLDDILERIG